MSIRTKECLLILNEVVYVACFLLVILCHNGLLSTIRVLGLNLSEVLLLGPNKWVTNVRKTTNPTAIKICRATGI